ncbi:MAG TPA: AAA family ATPase [Fervidobacterium nodosum]|nr:AAA family ATPase [Fervidobacterium nodosum]
MFLNFLQQYNLTRDQIYAAKKLEDFIYNYLDFLIIQGSAGTGKTFLISQYVRYLFEKGKKFVILAPTGRAAKILHEKSGFETKTIHSEIYSFSHEKVDLESEIIKVYFCLKKPQRDNTIFIIDESSMISDNKQSDEELVFGSGKLLSDFIEYVKSGENNKIIFFGDEYQLPPTNSSFSPALDVKTLQENFHLKGEKIFLNEVVRQRNQSKILNNANTIKKHIDDENYLTLKFEYDGDEFVKTHDFIKEYNYSNPGEDIIIVSTNKKALEYNMEIRKKLGFQSQIEVGDILLNTKNVYCKDKLVFNGEFFKVEKVINYEGKDAFVGRKKYVLEFYDLELKNINSGEIIESKVLANSLFSETADIDSDLKKALFSFCIHDVCKKTGLSQKNITQNLSKYLQDNPYLNALHVKYGYAITAHKSQGGEWDRAFIDPYYYNSTKTKEYFRWLYTSITRAKKKVYIKDLPIKIFSFNKLKIQNDFTLREKINISYNLNFNDEMLRELYTAFESIISKHSFNVLGIEHLQYQEVYYIKSGNHYLKVQLYYDKNYEPTSLKILETTNNEQALKMLSIINSEVQNSNNFNIDKNNKINSISISRCMKKTLENECVKIYIDGSYDESTKKIGAGFVVVKESNEEKIETYWRGFSNPEHVKHRNVAGEIYAALLAFEYAKNENLKCIEINYDYEGIEKWALGLWKTNTSLTKLYKEKYDYYSTFFRIKFNKVKAHTGEKYNEIADNLAKKAVNEEKYHVKYEIDL